LENFISPMEPTVSYAEPVMTSLMQAARNATSLIKFLLEWASILQWEGDFLRGIEGGMVPSLDIPVDFLRHGIRLWTGMNRRRE
jgi:hypothetical protein